MIGKGSRSCGAVVWFLRRVCSARPLILLLPFSHAHLPLHHPSFLFSLCVPLLVLLLFSTPQSLPISNGSPLTALALLALHSHDAVLDRLERTSPSPPPPCGTRC